MSKRNLRLLMSIIIWLVDNVETVVINNFTMYFYKDSILIYSLNLICMKIYEKNLSDCSYFTIYIIISHWEWKRRGERTVGERDREGK